VGASEHREEEEMLYLRMFGADLSADTVVRLAEWKAEIGRLLRPLVQPTLETPAAILGVATDMLSRRPRGPESVVNVRATTVDGEVFTDGESLLALRVVKVPHSEFRPRQARPLTETSSEAQYGLDISWIGPCWDSPSLSTVLSAVERVLGVVPSPFFYPSKRFGELKEEGRESPAPPSPDELRASELLCDRDIRTLALAIKASGGLLVRDVPKQLPPEARERHDVLTESLKSAHLVDSEIVVVCSKTQAQVTRAPSRELLSDLSLKGLKCACGRSLIDERIEEALAITELGRSLLDKARWLTLLVVRELETVGVSRDAVLIEQTVGGDEIDCLANISGELALFELKDKEFNLGNAYSFGAKIGIIRPEHPVIVTTEHVGNDAKEHFVRARSSGASRGEPEEPGEIEYIEGVQNLRKGVEDLVSGIYRLDAIERLNKVFPLAALDGRSVIDALKHMQGRKVRVAEGAA